MNDITDSSTVWQFFNNRLGLHASADFRGVCHMQRQLPADAMASMDEVIAAVAYNAFVGRTCCMHTVVQRPQEVTRRMIRDAFEFAFVTCNCEAVMGLVDSTNEAALTFDNKLGFKEVARVPNGGTDGDLIVLQMLRSECRWIRKH